MSELLLSIEKDGQHVLDVLNLTLEEVRMRRGTRTITHKKKLLYSYLRTDRGYSLHEIANYTHKDHTTILTTVKNSTKLWQEHKHLLVLNQYKIF
jgi:chromosomal replication initiation ATPase DnaA